MSYKHQTILKILLSFKCLSYPTLNKISQFQYVIVLVCMDCHNKILRTSYWLKQQKCRNVFSHTPGTWKSETGRFDLFWGLSPWLEKAIMQTSSGGLLGLSLYRSLFYNTSHIGLGAHLSAHRTSLVSNLFFKGHVLKYHHLLRYWS